MLGETALHERSTASLLERNPASLRGWSAAPQLKRSTVWANVRRFIRARRSTFERFLDRFPERLAAGLITIARIIRRGLLRDTSPPAIVRSPDDSRA
jgi:hypothetical protein